MDISKNHRIQNLLSFCYSTQMRFQNSGNPLDILKIPSLTIFDSNFHVMTTLTRITKEFKVAMTTNKTVNQDILCATLVLVLTGQKFYSEVMRS